MGKKIRCTKDGEPDQLHFDRPHVREAMKALGYRCVKVKDAQAPDADSDPADPDPGGGNGQSEEG